MLLNNEKQKENLNKTSAEIHRIAKLAKEAYKNVSEGKSTPYTDFLMGFVAGYQKGQSDSKSKQLK